MSYKTKLHKNYCLDKKKHRSIVLNFVQTLNKITAPHHIQTVASETAITCKVNEVICVELIGWDMFILF